MLQRFGKTKAWVEDDVLLSQVAQLLDFLSKIKQYLLHEVVVVWCLLHGLWRSFHVHQHVGHTETCHCGKHFFVEFAARDVVDDLHSIFFHAHLCHIGSEGIYRHDGIGSFLTKDAKSSSEALHLFLCGNVVSVGARRIGTDVNHLPTFSKDLFHPFRNFRIGLLSASRIEGVGCHVQNAHHLRRAQVNQLSVGIDGVV